MMNIGRAGRIIVGALIALTVVVAAALASLPRGSASAGPTAAPVIPSKQISALERPPSVYDDLSDRKTPLSKIAEGMPVDTAATRVVERSPDGSEVALIPRTDGSLCLHLALGDGTAGSACGEEGRAMRDGLAVGPPGRQVGLVPDGIRFVQATMSDGSSTSVPVNDNVFHAPAEAVSVSFAGQSAPLQLTPRKSVPLLWLRP